MHPVLETSSCARWCDKIHIDDIGVATRGSQLGERYGSTRLSNTHLARGRRTVNRVPMAVPSPPLIFST